MTTCLILVAMFPALLVLPLDGRPVRFGAPVPAAAVQTGLRLEGQGSLQWRRLPFGRPDADPVWVEIAISGPPGTVRIVAGDGPPSPDGNGAVFTREQRAELLPHGRLEHTVWRYVDGAIDERRRLCFTAVSDLAGERYQAGEYWTQDDDGLCHRADVLLRLGRPHFVGLGLLPRPGRSETTRLVRQHLQRLLPRLRELPGARGAGDYGRSGEVVTNLEFDTTLALLQCALGLADDDAWRRSGRSARHLVDRDLDQRSGLPFPHGGEHRTGQPEPGHAWLQGLLWVGLLRADDELITAAVGLGNALATHPPLGTGKAERLRDFAWPLGELEALLALAHDPVLARAADRLAASIARRYDAAMRTFRFGEGEVGGGVYFERGWLVGGVLLPALRAHLRRRPNADFQRQVDAVEAALVERVGRGGPGVPTHWRLIGSQAFAEHREQGSAEAAFLLDGLSAASASRLLRRAAVRDAVVGAPSPDDPDLATQFTMLARCAWVWR